MLDGRLQHADPHVDQVARERERNGDRQPEGRRQQGVADIAG